VFALTTIGESADEFATGYLPSRARARAGGQKPDLRAAEKPGGGVLGVMLIARMHLNPQYQSQIR